MAKKSLGNQIKKEIKSDVKRSVKKNAKKAVKNAVSGGKSGAPKRHILLKILPYFIVVFALILAIFFITVHIMEDDAGFIGNAVQYIFGGLFGGGAVLFPLALGFFGVKWCIYNVKWKESSMRESAEDHGDYKRAKGRLVMQGIMAFLVILMVSGIFGVFAEYDLADGFDIIEMWQNGGENLLSGGGGILGSGLAALIVGAIKVIPSIIVLSFLLFVFALLMFGLTPDYIITKIQAASVRAGEARAARQAEKLEREEAERAEAAKRNAELAKQKPQNVKTSKTSNDSTLTVKVTNEKEATVKNTKTLSGDDIEELLEDGENKNATVSETVIKTTDSDPTEELLKNLEPEVKKEEKKEKKEKQSKENGGDFGGEPGFDDEEFDPIEDLIKNLDPTTGEVVENKEIKLESKPEKKKNENIDLNKIDNEELLSDALAVTPDEADEGEEEEEPPTPYVFPPIDLLSKGKNTVDNNYNEELQANARQLVNTLQSFRINIKEISYSRGPTITRYELKPEAGVRVRSIANLVDDISLSLATSGVRIEAPIPGKPAVGIEVPNRNRATVYLRDLIDNSQFTDAKSRLTASLGMDVGGNPIYFDISKMPHMLIAGATGMGKSVCINCIIISLLYKARPEDLKLILIDPKKVEFNIYKDIPHLYAPIVSEPKKAAGALASAVAEMERRFELIEDVGVRDIASYNAITENDPYKEHMPHMVIIIDELADLMMTAPDEVETAICRLAQKARAAGIHIIIGTQRPSVDVITGLIKANIPSRIACTVASQVDSRTIIDIAGAEKLIGRGDMLFAPVGAAKPMRVQGAFVTDGEVENIVTFIRDNNSKAKYNAEFINRIEEEAAKCGVKKGASSDSAPVSGGDEGGDSKFAAAVKLAVEEGKISTSLMQRRLGVGYGRAAKIIDTMEEMGYVSKPDGNKPRRVLLTTEEYAQRVTDGTLGGADV